MRCPFVSGLVAASLFLVLATIACKMPYSPQPSQSTVLSTSISITRTTGPAPFAVNVDAIKTASPLTTRPFDECAYEWNVGETGLSNWTYGARGGTLSKNIDQGPLAGHVYETPGTYTITLNITDGTSSTTAQVQVIVTDPEVVYAGTNTICIANGTLPLAGASGVPAGAPFFNETSWPGVLSRFAPGKRMLLKRGDSWTTPTQIKTVSPALVGNPPVAVSDWKLTAGSYGLPGGAVLPVLRDFFNFTKTSGVLGACNQ